MIRYFLSIRAFCLVVAAVIGILIVTGCGAGGSSSATAGGITVSTGTLSKAEFVKQANAICTADKQQIEGELIAFLRGHRSTQSVAAQKRATSEGIETILVPAYEQQIDRIVSLGAPSGDEETVASFLGELQQWLDEVHRAPTNFSHEQPAFSKAAESASAYGLSACAESLS